MEKCKVCGGSVARIGNVNECEMCSNRWINENVSTVGTTESERAWEVLRNGDFEKATELFNGLIFKDGVDYEAYWGKALADNGIVYVTDLDGHRKVPTCNKLSEESFLDNFNVLKAISKAPTEIAEEYKKQAEQIENIRIEWVEKASREPACDIFISYKQSDESRGIKQTKDSEDAHRLYSMLTNKGYNVFYSNVSLTGKISDRYEPYIYNAIRTAKIMIVFGERPEYFTAPWIKNEWGRYAEMIKNGAKRKDSLIVVYKDMNPGSLPEALASRQSVDFDRIEAVMALFEHIKKIIDENGGSEKKQQSAIPNEYVELLKKLQEREENESISANFDRDFNYEVDEKSKEIAVVNYIGKASKIVIPEHFEGYTITVIKDKCFEDYKELEKIVLPNTIRSIGNLAFASCEKLSNINIPDSVESIGVHAFLDCQNLKNIEISRNMKCIQGGTFCCSGLESVIIPHGVTIIEMEAFKGCYDLKRVSFPSTLKKIGIEAFANCGLTSVNIPESVFKLANKAFYGCFNLVDIKVPESVLKGKDVFGGCADDDDFVLDLI